MPTWTLQELEGCRQKVYPHVTSQQLINNFALWGGIIRFTLAEPDLTNSRIEFDASIDKAAAQFPSLFESVGKTSAAAGTSYYVLQIQTDNTYIPRWVTFGSTAMVERIASAMYSKHHSRLKDFLGASQDDAEYGALRGYLFEGLVHNLLSHGGTFEVCSLNGATRRETLSIAAQPNSYPTVFEDLSGINQLRNSNPPPTYFRPQAKNFCAVDSILFDPTPAMIQTTVSKVHPVKMKGLVNIVEYFGNPQAVAPGQQAVSTVSTGSKYRLYFAVPPENYSTFQKQNYLNADGKVVQQVNQWITNYVEQWVMMIKFTAS